METKGDVIIYDLRLPIISGAKLLEALHETYPGVPVIAKVMSGSCEPHYFLVEGGDKTLILKPWTVLTWRGRRQRRATSRKTTGVIRDSSPEAPVMRR